LKRVGVQAKHEYNGGKKEERKRKSEGKRKQSKDANGPSVAPAYHVTHKRDDLRYVRKVLACHILNR
jgi:hypothetical protein